MLTTSLLERMRNNVMVVEVWDKKTTAEKDQVRLLLKTHILCYVIASVFRYLTQTVIVIVYGRTSSNGHFSNTGNLLLQSLRGRLKGYLIVYYEYIIKTTLLLQAFWLSPVGAINIEFLLYILIPKKNSTQSVEI